MFKLKYKYINITEKKVIELFQGSNSVSIKIWIFLPRKYADDIPNVVFI